MMTTTKIQKNDITVISLTVSSLLVISSFFIFGYSSTTPLFLAGLFFFNSIVTSYTLKKAQQTGKIFLWGLGAKGLKTLIVFAAFLVICVMGLVEDNFKFGAFFCLGFVALMIFEVKHIVKEFGKEIEC